MISNSYTVSSISLHLPTCTLVACRTATIIEVIRYNSRPSILAVYPPPCCASPGCRSFVSIALAVYCGHLLPLRNLALSDALMCLLQAAIRRGGICSITGSDPVLLLFRGNRRAF